MDWLEKLNAERRGDSGPPKPPPQKHEPSPVAIVALILLVLGHLAAYTVYDKHDGFSLAAMLQATTLGFWIGAGRGPFWLRWGIMGISAPYFRFLMEPEPWPRTAPRMSIEGSPLQIGLFLFCLAVVCSVLPRAFSPVRAKWQVTQFSIAGMMGAIAAVAWVCVMWRPAVVEFDPDRRFWTGYMEDGLAFLSLAVVVACVGSILCFDQPEVRKTVLWRAVGVWLLTPLFYFAASWFLGIGLEVEILFAIVIAYPITLVLLYPLDIAANGFGVRWLRKLDESPPADEAELSAGEDVD
ncbi:hypothetical protein [Bremerella cremea]|nr:hypothetical protein [Bremerella cremea]